MTPTAELRQRLQQWETERASLLEKMEALQTRLDQSPGQQQVNLLSEQMVAMRTNLEQSETLIADLTRKIETQTPPPPNSLNPPNVDDIPEPAPAPPAPPANQPQGQKRQKGAWH